MLMRERWACQRFGVEIPILRKGKRRRGAIEGGSKKTKKTKTTIAKEGVSLIVSLISIVEETELCSTVYLFRTRHSLNIGVSGRSTRAVMTGGCRSRPEAVLIQSKNKLRGTQKGDTNIPHVHNQTSSL